VLSPCALAAPAVEEAACSRPAHRRRHCHVCCDRRERRSGQRPGPPAAQFRRARRGRRRRRGSPRAQRQPGRRARQAQEAQARAAPGLHRHGVPRCGAAWPAAPTARLVADTRSADGPRHAVPQLALAAAVPDTGRGAAPRQARSCSATTTASPPWRACWRRPCSARGACWSPTWARWRSWAGRAAAARTRASTRSPRCGRGRPQSCRALPAPQCDFLSVTQAPQAGCILFSSTCGLRVAPERRLGCGRAGTARLRPAALLMPSARGAARGAGRVREAGGRAGAL